ncbi:hypothetical protein C9374_009139 [Naegleria lovaniensis]|uniref:E3 ubiquitin-protein ligase listerin n=1 Tax=Naegleria lovaniensis TaxID=51637 RepID=A0AA88KHA4_NAELO|nr:uncharacterized protein C9374_009139 [Naegleria lovaniensis]KAG2377623.1 hypothetical protein C9374_009139 [Naegleria lovaniensis]
MGKNEGQRKPKSQKGAITSSQAASIVSSSGSSTMGFGSSLMAAFNKKAGVGSSSAATSSVDSSSSLDPTVQSYLKHLNKRDPTTRSKALQSLTQYISEKADEEQISICKQLLANMEDVFKRIAVLDLDRKVRLHLFVLWKLIVQKVGKQLGHYIKKLMPYWLMEMVGIDDKDVSKAAVSAFHQAFAADKRDAAILYCDTEIMSVLFENFNQTVESLSLSETEQQSITKEEAEERYSRFITSSILMLNKMIDLSMQPKKDDTGQQQTVTLDESYSKIFRSKNFWKFLGIKSYNNIREAMSRLSITLLKNDLLSKDDTEVMEHIVPFIAPIFIGCFNQQPLERTTLDSLILFLQKFAPECWTHVNIWKQTFPRFFSFLRDPPNPSTNYSVVLPFVSMLNTDVYGAEKSVKFVSDLFENIWTGFEKVSSSTKQSTKADKDAIIDTLCDCIIYITLQLDKYAKEDSKAEVLTLARNTLVKTCTYYLSNSCTVNFGKYLTTAIGKLQSKTELSDYMSQFWTQTTEFCLANLDKIDMVSIEIFISRCSKADNTDHILNLANTLFQKSMKTGQIGVASAIAFANNSVLSSALFEESLETLWQINQQNEHVQQLTGLYFTQFPDQFNKLEKLLEQDIKSMSSSASLFPFLRSLYSEDSNFNQTSLSLEKSLLARKDLDSIEHLTGHKLFTSKQELRTLLTSIIDQHQDTEERAVEFIMATPGEFSVDINVLLSLFKASHYDVLFQLLSPKKEHFEEEEMAELEEDGEEAHKEEEFKSVVTDEMKNELFEKISSYLKEALTTHPTLTNDMLLEQFLKLMEISGTKNFGDSVLLNTTNDQVWSFIRGKCASNLKPIIIGNEVIWNNTKTTNLNELEKSVFMYSRLICVALDFVDTVYKNDVNTRENRWEWLLQEVLHSYYFEFLFNDYTKNLINEFLSNVQKKDGLNIEFCNYLAQRHELELLKIYVSMNSASVSQLDCNRLLFGSLENVNQVIEDKNKSSTFYEIADSLFDNDTNLANLNIDSEKVTEWLLGCISISSTLDQLQNQSEYDHLNLIKVQAALSIMYCRLKMSSSSEQTDEEITVDSIIDFAKEFYEMIKQKNPTQMSIIVSNLLINAYTTTSNIISDHSFVEEFILSNLQQISLEDHFELLDKIVHLAASVAQKNKNIKIVRQLIDTFLLLNRQSKILSMQYPIVMERLITRTSKYLKPLQLALKYSEIKLDPTLIPEIVDIIECSPITNAKIVSVDLLLLTDYHNDIDRIIDFMERMKSHISEHFNSILKESAVRNKHLTQFAHLYSEYSNDNNNELPYLLAWYYILSLTENSILSQQSDSDLFTKLKENQMYAPVLSLLTCFLYSGEDTMLSLEFREFCDDLMYKFSKVLPLFVRTWFNDCNDTIAIDWIQKRFLEVYSPAIVKEEISKIKKSDALTKSLGAKISMGNQIIAKYEQDEVVLKLTIKIPDLYPLKALQIESDEHSAVNESKYRKWILKMTTMLFSQVTSNGVSDVLMLWKDNLEKYFSGVEPCPICYSVVSGRDHQLPKIECKVCHNKFHGACLYRWFSTSGNQSCPMCRSVGQFK